MKESPHPVKAQNGATVTPPVMERLQLETTEKTRLAPPTCAHRKSEKRPSDCGHPLSKSGGASFQTF